MKESSQDGNPQGSHSPNPSNSDSTLSFYEEKAQLYAGQWNNPALMSDPRSRVMSAVPSPATVLDLGCGTGRDALAFAAEGYQVTGLDYSEAMLTEAVSHCASAGLDASGFICGDMRSLPFPDASFEVVWMSASLLHLPRAEAHLALEEAYRVFNGDGVLYTTVKDIAASGGAPEGVDPSGRFYTYWDAPGFKGDVKAAGFDVLEEWPSATGDVPWLNILAR